MKRLILAVGILTLSTALVAESGPASGSSSSSSLPSAPAVQTSTTTTTTTTTTTDWKHNQPVFTMPFLGSYAFTNLNNETGGLDTSFFGWALAPTYQFTRHIAARFDLEQDYDPHVQLQRFRTLRLTAGPEFTFPVPLVSKWMTPYVYAEGGATRLSVPTDPATGNSPYIQWEATADAGLGLQVPITRRIGFVLIPGEYSTFQLDKSGDYMGNFSAKAGFVINLYGDR